MTMHTENWTENKKAFESVSYTHLRAHETVLDLVCRLLLEKKKYIREYQVVTTIKLRSIDR